jgi:CHAT domain-containing protein/tetratricopeptide (TPR) repeat protein
MKTRGMMQTPALRRAMVGFAFCTAALSIAVAQNDATALQQRAIGRIDGYRQDFLKTGDSTSLAPELERAGQELSESLDQFTRSGAEAEAALSLLTLGELRRMQKRHAEAIEFFTRGFALAKKTGDATYQARARIGQGRSEMEGRKDFAAAGDHFQEAVTISSALPDRTQLFNALSYVAQVQLATGDMVGAADLLNRALALAPEVKDQSLPLFVYLDRADIYWKLADKCDSTKAFAAGLENLKLARADYDTAIALARKFDYAGIVPMIEQLVRGTVTKGQMIERKAQFDAKLGAHRIFSPKKPSDVLANEEFATKPMPEEVASMHELLQQTGVLDAGDARSFVTRGHFHSMQGEADKALADYLRAAELLETDRRKLRDAQSRGGFFNDKIAFYYPAITQLLQRKRFAEAFELMERSRSRAMADLMFSKKLALAQPEEEALFGEAQRLRAEIALLQKKLFDYRTRADREAFASEIKSTEQQIEQLEKQDRAAAAQMTEKTPRLHQLIVSEPASLDRVQQMLRRDECDMLYYLVLDEGLILWHIGGESVHVRSVVLPRSALKAKVAAVRGSVSSRDAKFDEKAARELFLFLIQPALGWIKSQQLVLIPHAELNHLPFAVLIDPSGKSLGETFALSDAPSAGILLDLKKGEAIAKGRLLATADPGIEEARGEVEAVVAFYAGRSKTVVEPLIAESEVKSSAGDYDVLHFSVHGKFNPLEPMLSYLQFGQDARDDGRLTAAEMFGLPLGKARLVVLSACETGQAEATAGNEILGMERALLYAGANNLVLSAWPVDSASTALWMKTFHREAQQKPLAEAARLALVEVKGKYPGPYHWAAFRLVGK